MKLKVQRASVDDVYKDIARIAEQYRIDARGNVIPEGSVCRIVVSDATSYAIVRGLGDSSNPVIHMDERLRNVLRINVGDEIEVRLETVGIVGQFQWAWGASDPAYRVAARLSLLSVVLGLLGLAFGLLSLRACL